MATWLSNYLGSLGLGPDFEPYITGVLYDQNLSEEDKSATIYECFEESCDLVSKPYSFMDFAIPISSPTISSPKVHHTCPSLHQSKT